MPPDADLRLPGQPRRRGRTHRRPQSSGKTCAEPSGAAGGRTPHLSAFGTVGEVAPPLAVAAMAWLEGDALLRGLLAVPAIGAQLFLRQADGRHEVIEVLIF